MVNPPSAQSITEVRILANGSLSSLQFAKGLSTGISGNEGLSFMVSNVYSESYQDLFYVCDDDKKADSYYVN